jgi:hypothetical protein
VRLLYHAGRGAGRPPGPAGRWTQTPWGRILIGLLLAQGLYYGLQHLFLALLMALSSQGLWQLAWTSTYGLLALQVLQVFTLLMGGILAGGGHRSGAALGAMVGAWNGVLGVLVEPLLHPEFVPALTAVALCGRPLLHAAFGALGGWVGRAFWRPPAEPKAPGSGPARKPGVARRRGPVLTGPVAWLRVALGSAVAVAGCLSAATLFNFLLDASAGKLSTTSVWQDRVIIWEIQALAVLVGSAAAGYNTPNGLKQGLFVGATVGVVLMGLQLALNRATPEVATLTVAAAFVLSLTGGWFGGQLFPPVVRFKGRGLGPAPLA